MKIAASLGIFIVRGQAYECPEYVKFILCR
jgi:hypothetical protein